MLREQWEKACNGYLVELLRMWGMDAHYGFWIGDEVGGMYDYAEGVMTVSMDDIIYCVEHDVESKEYMAWQEYICDASEFGFDTPNLKSWMMGCPRTKPEVFERLRGLKAELQKAVEEERERIKNEPPNPALGKKIIDCNLSVRTTNICNVNDIKTLGDITKLKQIDWLSLRYGGKKSMKEIDDLLAANGLSWANPNKP